MVSSLGFVVAMALISLSSAFQLVKEASWSKVRKLANNVNVLCVTDNWKKFPGCSELF